MPKSPTKGPETDPEIVRRSCPPKPLPALARTPYLYPGFLIYLKFQEFFQRQTD